MLYNISDNVNQMAYYKLIIIINYYDTLIYINIFNKNWHFYNIRNRATGGINSFN